MVAVAPAAPAAIVAPAAPVWAAQPSITVEAATIDWPPVTMYINGYATCSQPTGQAEISVWAVQFSGGFPSDDGATTITCGAGPVPWVVTVTTNQFNPWQSGQIVYGSANLVRAGTSEASACPCVTAW